MPLCTFSARLPASKPTTGWIPVKVRELRSVFFQDKAGAEQSIRIAANFVEGTRSVPTRRKEGGGLEGGCRGGRRVSLRLI
jgi:hypothetical protein